MLMTYIPPESDQSSTAKCTVGSNFSFFKKTSINIRTYFMREKHGRIHIYQTANQFPWQ